MAVTDLATKAQIVTLKSLGYSNFSFKTFVTLLNAELGKFTADLFLAAISLPAQFVLTM